MRINQLSKPTRFKRALFFIVFDILLSVFTIYLSFLLRFNFDIPSNYLDSMFKMIYVLIPLKIFILFALKIYYIPWQFFGLSDYKKLTIAHIVAYAIFTLLFISLKEYFLPFPRSVILIDLFLSLFFIGLLRISKRLYLEKSEIKHKKKLLIIGATRSAVHIIKSAFNGDINYHPVAIVSNDKNSIGSYISNIKVYAQSSLFDLIKKYKIESVVIAEQSDGERLDKLFTKLKRGGVKEIKIAQIFQDDTPNLKNLSVEDLLARKPKDLDQNAIKDFIKDKTILITGSGGSIGSEICRQCVKYGAKKLILLDHSEYNLYKIEQELEKEDIVPILQSVIDKDMLEKTFKLYDIDIVIHAAAYKHVPLCEQNIEEAIKNNILGTKNVIDLSIKYSVDKVVLISTDKAVRPTNVMGATKRVCELYAQNIDSKDTKIVSVRFGNVLGSSGSVMPKFKKQIEDGGPITVTHPDITRYFMLIPEACQLVLQSASIGNGRELFILDMGKPVKIADLAKKMIELSGRDEMKIIFTGLRPGEKLYEELLINESDAKTRYKSILIAKSTDCDVNILKNQIKELLVTQDKITKLQEIVPEFRRI